MFTNFFVLTINIKKGKKMINLNTFQTIILKFYILPILIIGFIFSYNTTYVLSKFFVNDSITINKTTKQIKEIQRRNILLNGVELKKWTALTQNQKEYFLNNEKEKLEDKSDKKKSKKQPSVSGVDTLALELMKKLGINL